MDSVEGLNVLVGGCSQGAKAGTGDDEVEIFKQEKAKCL